MSKPKLLIIEDDAGLCAQYRLAFPGCRVLLAGDRRQAEALARAEQPAAALLDLSLPPDEEGPGEGYAALASLTRLCPGMPVVITGSQEQREHLLRAVGLGAYDFCEKPADFVVLRLIIDRALRLRELEEENLRLASLPRPSPIRDIVTADDGMLRICRTVERLAQVAFPVLLLGESGTGKEALARALHDLGPRAGKPFVAVNCAAIPEALLEAELFGHERGAFAGAVRQAAGRIESAHGGTLFLDELGDLPVSLQARLLRFLQEQVIERVGGRTPIRLDVRIVSAADQPLEEQDEGGRFRADLLYRLNAVTIRVPPLRDRGEDRLLLARWFLGRYAREFGRRARGLDASAAEAIAAHRWPGNVRELGNRIRRAALMAEGQSVTAADLELAAPQAPPDDDDLDLRAARLRVERSTIERALARSNGSLAAAARLLGISRPTIYGLLETHRLQAGQATSPDPAPPPADLEEG
jgi:two-component system NtrC family response regulator